jgi:aminoglycoside phosphotransferase family enzyme/predicted kinase
VIPPWSAPSACENTDVTSPSEPFVMTHETHTAVVFLVGDRAYKLKKPVNLGFLDFTTTQQRLAACEGEVELNRRMSPDVYLGVWAIVEASGKPRDHLVVMRRMPSDRRLATLVRAGAPVADDIRRLARLLAAFHSRARRGPEIAAEGSRNAILGRWKDSFEQVRRFRGGLLDDGVAAEIERLTVRFLAGRAPLFSDRVAAGRVVDGHGDVLAEDVFCLPDGPRVLDCLEFNDRLRWLDGLDDVAFLAMDLEHLGAPDLGARLLDWYAEYAADPAPGSLRHHYVAYRAFVRAKVGCMRHEQGDADAAGSVTAHADLTLRHLRAGVVALVLVGGLPATGKSTLAGGLADRLGAVMLSSDHVRKELAGLAPQTPAAAPFRQGIYTPDWTDRTYAELLSRAEMLLGRGESVILDASWTRESWRARAASVAERTDSDLVSLRCDADPDLVVSRLRHRARGASDADEAAAASLAAVADPWPDACEIRTDGDLDDSIASAVARIRPSV